MPFETECYFFPRQPEEIHAASLFAVNVLAIVVMGFALAFLPWRWAKGVAYLCGGYVLAECLFCGAYLELGWLVAVLFGFLWMEKRKAEKTNGIA